MSIGKRIGALRQEKNLNQKELADKIHISYSVMNRIELGERAVRDEEINKIADILGTTSDYLLGRTNIKDPNIEKELPEEFTTPEEAVDFLLNQNVIMGFGGFDIDKLDDDEKIEFANELLNQLQLLSYKYKK